MRLAIGSAVRVLCAGALFAVIGLAGVAGANSTIPTSLKITTGPPEYSDSTEATFEFKAEHTQATPAFECSLDGAAPTPCESPKAITGLVAGPHKFTVFLVSESGPDKLTDSWDWTVANPCETSSPSPPGCLPPAILGGIKVTSPRVVRPGQAATLKASVKNRGLGAAANVKLCLQAPKRLIAGSSRRCVSIKRIDPGQTGTATFKLRAKRVAARPTAYAKLVVSVPAGSADQDSPPPPVIQGMAINEKGMCDERCKAELKKIKQGGHPAK